LILDKYPKNFIYKGHSHKTSVVDNRRKVLDQYHEEIKEFITPFVRISRSNKIKKLNLK